MLLDKTKVKSNYFKSGKSFNYFNNVPYIRNHSVSIECQLGFWSYPSLFDGKLLNLNEFDKGFQKVAAIFKSQGMTWLSNNDPMHVSIYE